MPNLPSSPRPLLGLASITAGVILAVFFWQLRVFWFQGGPLGIALIGLGGLDLWDARRHARGEAPRGLLQELRDELVGPARRPEPGDEAQAQPGETGSSVTEGDGRDDGEDAFRRH